MVTSQTSRRFLAPGDKLGKHEVIRQIAVGGMAELYLTRTAGLEGFEKLVCVKRILPQYLDNASFVSMFLSEARLAATLHHPNIVQVYDIGQDAGEYFFSMEYVHGEDLGQIAATGQEHGVPISLDCALTIATGLCAALHYAHEKTATDGKPLGIVHRDVSPTNVLVSYDGAVKLVDFGIARASGVPSSSAQTGLKGKIAYMSPEQGRGKVALDRRSDVFSIGTILYQLTTGRLPFTDETEYGVLEQIVNRDAEPPRTLVPDYPPALEAIVMRALARDPERRFATAQALQLELEDYAQANRLRVSPLVLARLMSTLFPARLEEWDHARAQGAFFMEQHVVQKLNERPKTEDPAQRASTTTSTTQRNVPGSGGQFDDSEEVSMAGERGETSTEIHTIERTELGPAPRLSSPGPRAGSSPSPASSPGPRVGTSLGMTPAARASSPPLAGVRASSPKLPGSEPSGAPPAMTSEWRTSQAAPVPAAGWVPPVVPAAPARRSAPLPSVMGASGGAAPGASQPASPRAGAAPSRPTARDGQPSMSRAGSPPSPGSSLESSMGNQPPGSRSGLSPSATSPPGARPVSSPMPVQPGPMGPPSGGRPVSSPSMAAQPDPMGPPSGGRPVSSPSMAAQPDPFGPNTGSRPASSPSMASQPDPFGPNTGSRPASSPSMASQPDPFGPNTGSRPPLPVPNMPGAVPIMPLMAPPVPSGGTLVSSATLAGNAPSAHGASGLSGGLVGLAGQTMQNLAARGPGYTGQGPPPGAGAPSNGAVDFGPIFTSDVTERVRQSKARPTLVIRRGRSRLLVALLAFVGVAGAATGVWLALGSHGSSETEPAAATKADPAAAPAPPSGMNRPAAARAAAAADQAAAAGGAAGSGDGAAPPSSGSAAGSGAADPTAANPAAAAVADQAVAPAGAAAPDQAAANGATPSGQAANGAAPSGQAVSGAAPSGQAANGAIPSGQAVNGATPSAPPTAVHAASPPAGEPADKAAPAAAAPPVAPASDPTAQPAKVAQPDPHLKATKPKPKRGGRGRKAEPKEQQPWNDDLPTLPVATPKH